MAKRGVTFIKPLNDVKSNKPITQSSSAAEEVFGVHSTLIPNSQGSQSFMDIVSPPKQNPKLNFRTLFNEEKVENKYFVLPKDNVVATQNKFANSLVGFFGGKRVAFPLVQNHEVIMVVPLIDGEGHTIKKTRVEYKWNPSWCNDFCVFGHSLEHCPKRVTEVVKTNTENQDDGFTMVSNKKKKGNAKENVQQRQIEGVKLNKPKPTFVYRQKTILNSKTDKTNDDINLVQLENSFDTLREQDDLITVATVGETSKGVKSTAFHNKNDDDTNSKVEEMILEEPKGASTPFLSIHKNVVRGKSWILLGDFNVALNLEDSFSSSSQLTSPMIEFKDCMENIEVMDLNCSVLHYTWNHKPKGDGGLLKKLDRVMGNIEFIDSFSGAYVVFQPYRISDHSPAILKIPDLVDGHNMYQIVTKLMSLKKPLRKLLHDQGNLHDRVNTLRHELDEEVVSENQSTFVLGRRIADNILITQELMHNYHRDWGPPIYAFKIDIQKAYDTVDWRLNGDIYGFFKGDLPVKYLGVPLISSKILIRDCKVLVKKATNRIGDWKNKSLSFASQLQHSSNMIVNVPDVTHLCDASSFSVRKVWEVLRDHGNEDILAYLNPLSHMRTSKSIVRRLLLAATSYYVWIERNNRWFKNVTRSPEEIRDMVMITLGDFISIIGTFPSKAYIVLNKETIRIKESLNVTFDESLLEPKSSTPVKDDRINEPRVQDLNGSSSLQVNVSDEGYHKSVKEARGHPIELVIGELNERTLRERMMPPDNPLGSLNNVLDNQIFNTASEGSHPSNMDMYLNDKEDDGDNMIISPTPSEEIRTRIDNTKCPPSLLNEIGEDKIWKEIRNPLSPNHIKRGYSFFVKTDMINSIKDHRDENKAMFMEPLNANEAVLNDGRDDTRPTGTSSGNIDVTLNTPFGVWTEATSNVTEVTRSLNNTNESLKVTKASYNINISSPNVNSPKGINNSSPNVHSNAKVTLLADEFTSLSHDTLIVQVASVNLKPVSYVGATGEPRK
nr:hypothetical protein [Tanacetum cinerariifolium]